MRFFWSNNYFLESESFFPGVASYIWQYLLHCDTPAYDDYLFNPYQLQTI
jgi:hypothetical protein